MIAPTRHLRSALGPILYQLPPSLHLNLGRLEAFLKLLPADLSHVFEFRDTSWYNDATLDLLDRFGAGFVAHDFPAKASPRWVSGGIVRSAERRVGEECVRTWRSWGSQDH